MGCLRLTYQETFTPLNVVYNDLNASDKCFLGDYRYGFNGMEKDDEIKGNGNSYDFGARLYDPRLGRWQAVDPLESKYPHLSPYQFVDNSPLTHVDPNGKENIIYLVVQDNNPDLDNLSADEIAAQANVYLNELGLKTKVVVFDESIRGKFNSNYMDNTDTHIVIGNSDFIEPRTGLTNLKTLGNADAGGNAGAVFAENVSKFVEGFQSSVLEVLAFGIVHEAGHNTYDGIIDDSRIPRDKGHTAFKDEYIYENDVNFMADGGNIIALFTKNLNQWTSGDGGIRYDPVTIQKESPEIKKIMDLFNPCRNSNNINFFNDRYNASSSSPTDNYHKNQATQEDGFTPSGNVLAPVEVTTK